jgi:hypothetical protein
LIFFCHFSFEASGQALQCLGSGGHSDIYIQFSSQNSQMEKSGPFYQAGIDFFFLFPDATLNVAMFSEQDYKFVNQHGSHQTR